MNKVIYFKMEVDGIETAVKSSIDLKEQLKAIKEAMKGASGEEMIDLEKRALMVKAALKDVEAEQRSIVKALQASKTGEESMERLAYSLGELREAYRKLSKEERDNKEIGGELKKSINQIDDEIKKLDASIGNYQRNIGNYEKAFQGFTSGIPIIGEVRGVMGDLGEAVGVVGKSVVIAVALFKGFMEASKYINEVVEKVEKLRGSIGLLNSETGVSLDEMTAKTQALAETFGEDSKEIVTGVNAVSKAFNVDYLTALKMVEDGFKSGANTGGKYLDMLKEYPVQFKDAGASAEEFFVVITEGAKSGIYNDKMVDSVKEFGLRIREQTVPTRDALIGAFGVKFTEELLGGINKGKISSMEALRAVSEEMGKTALTAKQSQTIIADVFGGPGEDVGMDFVLSLKDLKGSMDELIDTENEYAKKNERRLEINEEIARAEVNLSNAYKDSAMELGVMGGELKAVGADILTELAPAIDLVMFLLKGLWEVIKVGIQIVAVPFKILKEGILLTGEAIGVVDANVRRMNEGFKSGADEVDKSESKLRGYLSALKKTNEGTDERRAILEKIKALQPGLLDGYDLEHASISRINIAEMDLIATLRNKIAMRLKEKELEGLMAQKEDISKKVKEREGRGEKPSLTTIPNPMGGAPIIWTNTLADLKIEESDLDKNIKTIEDYYQKLGSVKLKEEEKVVNKNKSLGVDLKKENDEGKKALEELKKRNEEKYKAEVLSREALKSMIEKYEGIERDLVKISLEDTIKLMKEGNDKELAIEKARYEESVEALRKREEDFMKAAKEQGDKIALAFGSQNKEVIKMREKGDIEAAEKRAMIAGKTSNEYLNFMSKVEEQRAMIAKSTNLVIEEETEIHGKNIKTIDKQWNEERIKSLKEAMDKRYAVFDEKLKKEDLLERERVAKAYIENIKSLSGLDDVTQKLKVFEFDVKFNDESFTFEKTRLQKELKELNEEFAIKLISNVGEDELQKELTKIQALKTALIELEADRTKAKAEEAEKRIEIEKDEAERTLGYVGDVLGMISDLSDVTKERDFKNIDDRKEKEEEKLAKLEESLQGANAKEKVEIEKQIKFQKSKIKEVDDERRKVEEEAAIRTRFIRMAQLISTTALAVMSEYAKTGLVGAIMAGAAGAIQLGIMAAQPFAEGGLVDGVLSGELVGSSGAYMNISELSNGDNVLATLRKGEVVLNEEQQKKLGGDKVFKALGVKGFANGGRVGDNAVVGYSSGGADIAGLYMLEKSINNEKDKDIKNLMNEFKNGVFDMVSNINNRIDNIEVLFVIDDYEREVEDRDGAKKRVSLK